MKTRRPPAERGERVTDGHACDEAEELAGSAGPAPRNRRRRAGWGFTVLRIVAAGVLGAAVAMVASWVLNPAHNAATAWLRVGKPPFNFRGRDYDDDLVRDKQYAAALINSDFVLEAALRKPGVAELPRIRVRRDPVAWLKNHLRVSFPGGAGILQIAMTGNDYADSLIVVNAVRDAFLEEVVNVEREKQIRRIHVLQQQYDRNRERIEEKQLFRDGRDEETLELERLRHVTERMGKELEWWDEELSGPDRVTLLRACGPGRADTGKRIHGALLRGAAAFLGVCIFGTAVALVRRSSGRTGEERGLS